MSDNIVNMAENALNDLMRLQQDLLSSVQFKAKILLAC